MNATTHEEKAREYRERAAACDAENERRIRDQVDPGDCFISSWADSLNSKLYQTKARIEEQGGVDEFWGLFNLKGERVRAKLIEGRYGLCWALCDESGRFTGKFISHVGAAPTEPWGVRYGDEDEKAESLKVHKREMKGWERRVKNLEKKGFREEIEEAPAMAYMDGEGHGLSGRAWVAVKRTDGGYPANAVEA